MRREIFPALQQAYATWLDSGSSRVLQRLAAEGREHWRNVALQLRDSYLRQPQGDVAARIQRIVGKSHL
jgi:hypothetical protein